MKFSTGVDVLVHELGRWKGDPNLIGPPDEVLPSASVTRGQTRRQARAIIEHHTDGVEAGQLLATVKPRLAVFSHYNVDLKATLALVRQHYDGPVEFGEDQMVIDIGEQVTIQRPGGNKQ